MAKLPRVYQKQFGVNAGASDVGVFGSLAASSPQYSKDPATIQSLAAFLSGWAGETIANNRPALEDFNALDFLSFYQLCYLFQSGIPEWDASTTYYTGSICQVSGILYRSLQDDNLNKAPDTQTAWWEPVVDSPDVIALGNESGAVTLTDGKAHTMSVVDNVTLTLPSVASGKLHTVLLEFTLGAGKTLTLPGTVVWVYGNAPALSTSLVNRITFDTINGGTTWRAYYGQFSV